MHFSESTPRELENVKFCRFLKLWVTKVDNNHVEKNEEFEWKTLWVGIFSLFEKFSLKNIFCWKSFYQSSSHLATEKERKKKRTINVLPACSFRGMNEGFLAEFIPRACVLSEYGESVPAGILVWVGFPVTFFIFGPSGKKTFTPLCEIIININEI